MISERMVHLPLITLKSLFSLYLMVRKMGHLVAHGNFMPEPEESVYSSVASLCSLCIVCWNTLEPEHYYKNNAEFTHKRFYDYSSSITIFVFFLIFTFNTIFNNSGSHLFSLIVGFLTQCTQLDRSQNYAFFRIYLHYISFALHLRYICISHSPQNRYICITFH